MAADWSQPWLDDLSEEWVPQPATSPAASPAPSASPASPAPAPTPVAHSAPPKPRSRLPRPRHESASSSHVHPPSFTDDPHAPLPDDCGTVAHHTVAPSAAKANGHYDTPEWKRRLVKGEGSEQKDLFGPSGLESIFAKPADTPAKDTPQSKRKLGVLRGLSALPSSPPPWPAAAADHSDADRSASHTGSQVHHRQDSQQHASTADPDASLSVSLHEPARTVSGQIEFENEQFSPVFINTELEVGHTTSSVPPFRGSELANRLRQIGSPPPAQQTAIAEESSLNCTREGSSFARIHDDSLPEGLPAGTPDIADVGRFVELRRGGYSMDGSFRRRPLSPSPERTSTRQSSTLQSSTLQSSTLQSSTREPATRHSSTRESLTREPATRHSSTRESLTRESLTRESLTRESLTREPLTRHLSTRHLSTQHSSTQHSSTQHSSTQHSSTQHSSTQHSSTRQPSTRQGTGRSNSIVQTAVRDGLANASDSAIVDEDDSPRTPLRTPLRRGNHLLNPDRAKVTGSPLKLFGAHDTFTSNRLIRRLSQLEYKPDSVTPNGAQDGRSDIVRPVVQARSRLASVEEVSGLHTAASPLGPQRSSMRRVSAFGQGQLNRYQFDGEFSVLSSEKTDAEDDSAPEDSPGNSPENSPKSDVAPPGSRTPFRFHIDKSSTREPSQGTRQSSRHVSNPYRTVSRSGPQFKRHVPAIRIEEEEEDDDDDDQQDLSDGKRGPTSPFKIPTPKRRRTLNDSFEESDVSESRFDMASPPTQESHAAIQAVIGQSQHHLNPEHVSHATNSDLLARRHILRPRNPTPSQRRREEIEAEIVEATEAFMQASPKLDTIREQLEPSMVSDESDEKDRATAVANEVAMFTLRRHAMRNPRRKRSVTTQDFLDEALKIMNIIRTKGRPNSGLGELKEASEFDATEEASEQPSASLTFERPPSREGRLSAWRDPNKRQSDPRIVSHLRQYEETGSESFLSSSVKSVRISRVKQIVQPDETSDTTEKGDDQSSIHYIRPFGPNGSIYDPNDARPQTGQSAGSSLAHTIATNFSRRSDQVATLAPEAVAHLIPHQIAGMSFNREKKIWVRQKSASKEHRFHEEDHSSLNQSQSEEDPFGNIPDLSVSEHRDHGTHSASPTFPQPTAETLIEDDEAEDEGRPMTCASSVPSKSSNNFGWSFTKTETRATSCSTQAPRKRSAQKAAGFQTTYAIPESDEEDIEREYQYFEGRNVPTPNLPHARVRDITISFAERQVGDASRRPTEPQDHYGQPQNIISSLPQGIKSNWSNANGTSTLPRTRPSQRPRIVGEGDLSILDELHAKKYRMELSMNVAAPGLQTKHNTLLVAPSSPLKGDVTFMLSELPEFTLNQADEFEQPDRVIVKHDGTRYAKALEDRYAQGTAELVKALQDIEPDEPYWEDLREVSLRGKNLGSLRRLDELCYRLEELDVSDNNITQVEGIPYAMRRLQAQNNSLNGLTSWATLGNLQHLDISNNDIDSLDGLAELVHLRVLKVDNNKLKSLDSILHLDGLMELHAGNNDIDLVDFARSNLKSLTDLDLRKNRLLEVRNVHRLPQLQHLNLDDNELDEFPLSDMPSEPCKYLRSLRMCRNVLTTLHVDAHFPRLEALYVDSNSLTQVNGLENLHRLRTFSARDQMLDTTNSNADTCVSNLVKNTDVHNLYISLNPAYSLGITQHLLNLQRLELASMGLKELPDNFGQLTPNIRSVNLNFNSLQDLRPLLNIKRLSELLLAGNKVERLRQNAMVLGKFPSLSTLDWRDNPVTLRFYASSSENRVMSLRRNPDGEQLADRFVLPPGDLDADEQHQTRLDYETRIRRRVTEMMLANMCRNLRELDGLPFEKARILVKDDVWERLTMLGVIRRKQPAQTSEESY